MNDRIRATHRFFFTLGAQDSQDLVIRFRETWGDNVERRVKPVEMLPEHHHVIARRIARQKGKPLDFYSFVMEHETVVFRVERAVVTRQGFGEHD